MTDAVEHSTQSPDAIAAGPGAGSDSTGGTSHGRSPFPPIADYALPVRLRDQLPDRAQRRGRVDVPATAGLAERLQRDARPRRRCVPARPVRRDGPRRPSLPAGQPDGRDDLADPHRLADRPRRPVHGAVAQRRRAVAHPSALPDRLRRRALPAAHRAVRQRLGRPADDLRAGRSTTAGVEPALGVRRATATARSWRPAEGIDVDAAPDHRPAARHRGRGRTRATRDGRGRQPLRRAVLVAAAAAAHLRRGRRAAAPDLGVLAAVDHRSASSPTTPGAATSSAARSPSRA